MSQSYDVIIVGGGPAGCVLATRLTEDPERQVLLIEAGPDYGPNIDDWPHELHDPYAVPLESHSWGSVNVPNDAGHAVELPRTKILGGSATVNACIWNRCSAADFDHWAELGNPGWSFADLLPYFKKAESDPISDSELHGTSGPVPVWRAPNEERTPINEALIRACDALGIVYVDDFNGSADQFPSIARTTKNIATPTGHRVRMNPALTYLAMARERDNLEIVPNTLVDRVGIERRRATGILTSDGREYRAAEVILSSGAYQSPAILMRSGIGAADHLNDMGIHVITALPGVGENLMDHPAYCEYVGFRIKHEYVMDLDARLLRYPYLIKARSRQVETKIDLHVYNGEFFDEELNAWSFLIRPSLQYARSRGRVQLTAADPFANLDIDHRYFSNATDLEALCDGVELAQQIARTAPLSARLRLDDSVNDPPPSNREALRELVRSTHHDTTYHPSSTCKMGPSSDPMAVVDQAGRVYGIDKLRVVDASIMPYGPRGNLHFPVVAIAEKIADMIRVE